MDMLDPALDTRMMPSQCLSSQDKVDDSGTSDENQHIHSDEYGTEGTVTVAVENHGGLGAHASLIDPIPYQFKSENGQNTLAYRVVQVHNAEGDGNPQVATLVTPQTIITNSYPTAPNGAASPTAAEGHFTFYTDGGQQPDAASSSGQFYVMMSPQEVIQQGQRNIAPRTHQFSTKVDGTRTIRDEKRRATHNEVERRRRDKINNWIGKLSKIIPDCCDNSKQGQVRLDSKGGILAKACDYIHDLRAGAARVPELSKENEQLKIDLQMLRQQYENVKSQNQLLKALIQQHGLPIEEVEMVS